VFSGRTTISCSALALTLSIATIIDARGAQTPSRRPVKQTHAADDRKALSPFPVRAAWTLALNNAVVAPPAYDESRGFFPIEDKRLVAYDLHTGTQLWIASIAPTSAPAVGDGLVFVPSADALVALRATDGSQAWSLPFTEGLSVPLVWDNEWLIAATSAGDVLAFRARDGELLWRQHLDAPAGARPALSADRVYVSTTDSHVVALGVEDGHPVWRKRLGGQAHEILAFDDRLFVGSADKHFYCLQTDDGEIAWRWRTGADTVGAPVANDNTVFFVATDNVLRAVSRRSGVQRWKTGLTLRPSAGPLLMGPVLVVGGAGIGETHMLRAFNVSDGKAGGEFDVSAELAAAPHAMQASAQALSSLIVVTRHIVKGSTIIALSRSFDPAVVALTPLPNPVVLPLSLDAPAPTPP